MLLIFIPTVILLVATDASKMYHTVRGQDTIKLYVIFNALEVGQGPTVLIVRLQTDCVVLLGRTFLTHCLQRIRSHQPQVGGVNLDRFSSLPSL